VTQDEVAQFHGRLFRKIRNRRDPRIDHFHPHDDVSDQTSLVAVLHNPVKGKFVDLPDVVKDPAGDQQIPVDPRIMTGREVQKTDNGEGMFEKAADVVVVKSFGRRRPPEQLRDLFVPKECPQEFGKARGLYLSAV